MVKKRDGGGTILSSTIVMLITFIVTLCLIIQMVNTYSTLDNMANVNMTLRTYLLMAETKGGLSPNNVNMLEEDLKKYGLTDVHITGSLLSEDGSGAVLYGDNVIISLNAVFKTRSIIMGTNGILNSEKSQEINKTVWGLSMK